MTDKELLEYAALAMGFEHYIGYDEDCGLTFVGENEHEIYADYCNPLIDNHERWHMIEKLEMAIDFKECVVWKRGWGERIIQEGWRLHGDEAHAVLRVAAQIVQSAIGKRKAGK